MTPHAHSPLRGECALPLPRPSLPLLLPLLLPTLLLLLLSSSSTPCAAASPDPRPLRALIHPGRTQGGLQSLGEGHNGGAAHGGSATVGRALVERLGASAALPSEIDMMAPAGSPDSGDGGGDGGGEGGHRGPPPLLSPQKFVDPLPRPPVVSGSQGPITLGMYVTTQKFHRDMPPTRVYAYGTSQETAAVPGPTIEALRGVDTQVTWLNEIRDPQHMFVVDRTLLVASPAQGVPAVVHRHGGETTPASDGAPSSWYTAFNETGSTYSTNQYTYSNLQQPATLWYHDHTIGLTNLNIAAGLFGAYIIRDPTGTEAKLDLPQGDHEVPLVLTDRQFLSDGSIFYPSNGDNPAVHPHWIPEYFGNVQIVNGKVWPYLEAERAAYRFRIINGANARAYNISFICAAPRDYPNFTYPLSGSPITFYQIGSDGGYLNAPVRLQSVLLGVAQRADIVVDLAAYPGCADVIVTNDANAPYPGGDPVDGDTSMLMRIVIGNGTAPASTQIQAAQPVFALPARLNSMAPLNFSGVLTVRHLPMTEREDPRSGQPLESLMDGLHWTDPVTETPVYGSTEVWNLINTTPDNHPVHIHLIQFRLVSRQPFDEVGYAYGSCSFSNPLLRTCLTGAPVPAPPQEAGWLDTVLTPPGQVTTIHLKFTTQDGGAFDFDPTLAPGYSWHCHILNHEDNQKMRPLQILPGLKVAIEANTSSGVGSPPMAKGSVSFRPLTSLALALGILVVFLLI